MTTSEIKFLTTEIVRLRKEADRDERRALRNGHDPETYPFVRLNRTYAASMEAELAEAGVL